MFICENPSLGALQRIRESRLGGPPDFDTQWTGDPAKSHDERFRKVLCGLGLKDGEIWERGGWSCYITNVIKQAAFVRDWNKATRREKKPTVGEWSEILQMEIDAVRPDVVFCVGGEAHWMVKWLRGNSGLRIPGRVHGIWHYSARQSDEVVERKMRDGIEPYL